MTLSKLKRKEIRVVKKFGIVTAALALCLLLFDKGELVLWFSHHQTELGDFLMKHLTIMGDGMLFVPFILSTLFISYRHAISAVMSGLILTTFINIMKGFFFRDEPRPREYFKYMEPPLNLVDGVDVHLLHTFPSGHAATAAAILFLTALFAKRDIVTWICIVFAWLIAITRVYLAQHFMLDVVFGHLFGCGAALIAFVVTKTWLADKTWASRRLAGSRNKHSF